MIVHSSALLAILFDEPKAEAMLDALLAAPQCVMAATDWLHASMLIEEKGGRLAGLKFDEFFRASEIAIMPVTAAQTEAARIAWRHFGRHKHAARLEYHDCLSYGLAKIRGEPLLYADPVFARTDITAAVP